MKKEKVHAIPELKTYQCQYCEYKATRKYRLANHTESMHEGKTYQCQYCEYKATTKSNLTKHTQSMHEGKTRYLLYRYENVV